MRVAIGKATKTFVIGSACILAVAGNAMAEEDKPWADAALSAYSKYVWRGQELSRDSIVLQPSLTVGYKGFSVNFWSNVDTDLHTSLQPSTSDDKFNLNETDITLAYDYSFNIVSLTGGYIYYDLDGIDDSQELFFSAGLDVLLSPTITVYKEIAHGPAWYITADVSHSFPIQNPWVDDVSLDLGAKISYLASDDVDAFADPDDPTDEFSNFHDAVLSAALSIPAFKYFTISPEIYYSFPLSSDSSDLIEQNFSVTGQDDDFVYGGVTVSIAF